MKKVTRHAMGLLMFALVFMWQGHAFAQQVTGTITDQSTNETLPGVNIVVKGTMTGTSTNASGQYQLNVPSLNDTLVFSFIGYQTLEVPINGRAVIDAELLPSVYTGEEMVVVGYGEMSKQSITGSISSVSSKELEKTTSVTSGDMLVGKVQGITFRKADARPGATTSIEIRNMGNPLFIIDGVPAGSGDFNQLGQNDIESISILKDASAAVYGLRAANGVVLVETKKGEYSDRTQVNLSGYYGWQTYTSYPQPGNAYQFVRGKLEAQQNRGEVPNYLGITSADQLEAWRNGPDYKSYDYYDIVMEPNIPQYSGTASVSGGSENVNYYVSVTHLNEDAIIKDYNFNRTNFQANVEGILADGLTVGASVKARQEDRFNVGVPGLDDYFNPFLSIFSMWPTESPYANDNPNYVHQTHNVNVNPATYTTDVTGYVEDWWRRTQVDIFGEYEFDFGLTLKGTASYAYNGYEFDGFEYTYKAYQYDEATDTYFTQSGWGNENPWRERRYNDIVDRFYQLQASYQHQFGDHYVSALLAFEKGDNHNNYMAIHTVPANNYIPIMRFANQDYLGHDRNVSANMGYVGRFSYNYKEKYLVEFLGRYDASYLFPENSRWGFFPGVTAGWRISEEPFFSDNIDFISNLKLRVSYGRTGSDPYGLDPFEFMSGYNYGAGSYIFNGNYNTGLEPRGLPITNLSWVDNISKDIGIDISFFEDRLAATFDVFERKREGLPAARYDVLLPSEVGYGLPDENLESDAHRGFEGSISYTGQITDDLSFTIGGNATVARRRWLSSYKPRFGNSWDEYRTSGEDRWTDIYWGYRIAGRFQSEEQIGDYPVDVDGQGNRTLLPGDLIYEDVNNDGVINGMDQRPIGYDLGANPYLSFGINGSFSYKGVDLIYGFSGGSMQSYLRDWEMRYFFQNDGSSPELMLTDRWHRADPFDPNSEWIPGDYPANRGANYGHSNYAANAYWLSNVKYIRLRNLELGYTLPQELIGKVGVRNLRVYARGTNLLTFHNMKKYEIDPEIAATNALVYPQQRVLSLGFNMSL